MVFRLMLRDVVSCCAPLLVFMLDLRVQFEYYILLKGLLVGFSIIIYISQTFNSIIIPHRNNLSISSPTCPWSSDQICVFSATMTLSISSGPYLSTLFLAPRLLPLSKTLCYLHLTQLLPSLSFSSSQTVVIVSFQELLNFI